MTIPLILNGTEEIITRLMLGFWKSIACTEESRWNSGAVTKKIVLRLCLRPLYFYLDLRAH